MHWKPVSQKADPLQTPVYKISSGILEFTQNLNVESEKANVIMYYSRAAASHGLA